MPFFKPRLRAKAKLFIAKATSSRAKAKAEARLAHLTPEERLAKAKADLANARADQDAKLAEERAEFDQKNIDFRLVSAEKLAAIRAYTDEHIAVSRKYIAENIDILEAAGAEVGTLIGIRGNERRALIDAEHQANLERYDTKHQANLDAIKLDGIAYQSAIAACHETTIYNLYVSKTHNKRVWREFKAEVRGKQDASSSTDSELFQNAPLITNTLSDLSRITMTNFNHIQMGMPVADVVAILGDKGNIRTYDDIKAAPTWEKSWKKVPAFDASIELRIWLASVPPPPDETLPYVNGLAITVVFRDGVVVEKSQYDLKRNKQS